jgi:apolipoprotein N-acyltransferase
VKRALSNQQHDFLPGMANFWCRIATRHSFKVNFFLGCGLALALPPVGFVLPGLLCLSLLVLRDSQRALPGVGRQLWEGLGFGLGYFIVALHWIGFAFLVDATAYLWMMPFAVGGLALLMAAYWAGAFAVASWFAARGFVYWIMLPLCLSLAEIARGFFFTGFPWAAPGLIADGMGSVAQVASLAGQPGLTLLVLLWASACGQMLLWLWKRDRGLLLLPMAALVLLPLALVWGMYREAPVQDATTGVKVRLVQPNIPQSDKWRGDNAVAIFETLLRLTAAPGQPDVVVWPESSVPFLLAESSPALAQLDAVLAPGQQLLAGSLRREKRDSACKSCDDRYYTSILLIDDAGVVAGHYDKWRLVPGGEFLPLAWALEPLGFRRVVSLPESFTAGSGPANLTLAGIGNAAMLICYEAIFPDRLLPETERPRVIVNVTNDGWFGRSVGPYQHLAQVRMRAIEQGLPILRAANTGISAVIDSLGQVVAASTLETEAVVDAVLPASAGPTLFASFGFWIATAAMAVLFAIAGCTKTYRRGQN